MKATVRLEPEAGPRQAVIRCAEPRDAEQIHALIASQLQEGHLLRRDLAEITLHVRRFLVVSDAVSAVIDAPVDPSNTTCDDGTSPLLLACGELAPLSHALAEVRSLVVGGRHRGSGLGRHLVDALSEQARLDGFHWLCAFTHLPGYFAQIGFSIVPHVWLPEKIGLDCRTCALSRRCGQFAMVHDLEPLRDAWFEQAAAMPEPASATMEFRS